MELIKNKKVIMDEKNIYEATNDQYITVIDSNDELNILREYSDKGYSIKAKTLPHKHWILIKEYKIEKTEIIDENPLDENLNFHPGPLGEENFSADDFVLASERKYVYVSFKNIENK
ncbi:hypothetical protein [Methanobrevibacter curvatus]|uniref:Uncharacterized protein n=1 Tax=Methanobrevibacter curvatus TaxID=49547 RepID=A0A166C7T8_9EURY|nr:hypothetical protein [Methanobrevibacter curvatus]KZX12007.1 hypothetical protein MBCUR_12130 [Methanobrevibacter curvatus]